MHIFFIDTYAVQLKTSYFCEICDNCVVLLSLAVVSVFKRILENSRIPIFLKLFLVVTCLRLNAIVLMSPPQDLA